MLCDNCITPGGLRILAAGLRENTTLTLLDLNNNPVADEGAAVLAGILTRNTTNSGGVDAVGVPGGGHGGSSGGCGGGGGGGSEVRPPLEHISLWNTGIGKVGGEALATAVRHHGKHGQSVRQLCPTTLSANSVPTTLSANSV